MSVSKSKIAENASDAYNQAKKNQQDLALLKEQLEKQKCVTSALWQILKNKLNLSDEDFMSIFEESIKKQKAKVAPVCFVCGRPLQESSKNCIYCGKENPERFPM